MAEVEKPVEKLVKVEQASFKILNFKVTEVAMKIPPVNTKPNKLEIKFSPSGEYISAEGLFRLTFSFNASEKENKNGVYFKVISVTNFKFEQPVPLVEIPDFFYQNAIAIVFPYIRAYVSTLTGQSHQDILILPLLNLTTLENPLRENTVEVETLMNKEQEVG